MDRLSDHRVATGVALAAGLAATAWLVRRRPSLTAGSIAPADAAAAFADYDAAAKGAAIRGRTAAVVDQFYSLVTDIYEWGWGTSFHFSPPLPGKTPAAAEAAHEARIGGLLGVGPGDAVLDVGCGVGGPMRTVAATTGATVTGVTINAYQVQRAIKHNEKAGLTSLCRPVRADFNALTMFEAATFDGAYAVEATCHAASLESVYGEVHRVLKPGAAFVSYEWVATPAFDPANADHVRIVDEINYGNGLPELRTVAQAEAAGRAVGFVLERSVDLAAVLPADAAAGAGRWYGRLKTLVDSGAIHVNRALVATAAALRLAPPGLKPVHDMLCAVASSLVAGGETGVFSPCHLLVFRKPDAAAAAAAVAAVAPANGDATQAATLA